MIATDNLVAQLNQIGTVVVPGQCTFKNPAIVEPARYPKPNGPRGAQVRAWMTTMATGMALVRFTIHLHDLSGPFTEADITSTLARENRAQPFGSLKVWVLKSGEGSVFRGEVQYAVPVTGDNLTWVPAVVTRLLNVWQDTTVAVRAVAERAEAVKAAPTRVAPAAGQKPAGESVPATDAHVAADTEPESISDLLDELDGLVGMQSVKDEVRRLAATQEIARRRIEIGLRTTAPSPHLVFTGNPGTGKTTVARMIGRLYRSMGLLSSGHVVEVGRSDLVGGYIGQTALKTREVCESALGGVLFIDEAYSLRSDSARDYGHEAVETLLTFMEAHRGEVAVVVAGYPDEMASFIDMNPGLASRFDRTVDFPDYSNEELTQMLERMFRAHDYHVMSSHRARWRWMFSHMPRGRGFGNAREVRRLFDEITSEQALWLTKKGLSGHHELWRISSQVISAVTSRHSPSATARAKVPEYNLGYL